MTLGPVRRTTWRATFGVGVQRARGAALHPRRRLERPAVHVHDDVPLRAARVRPVAANFGVRRRSRSIRRRSSPRHAGLSRRSRNRDLRAGRPPSDDLFDVFRSTHAYDRTPIKAATEATRRRIPTGVRRTRRLSRAVRRRDGIAATVSCRSGGSPPYQTVLFLSRAPRSLRLRSSQAQVNSPIFAHVMRSGRAVVVPIVKGAYERRRATNPPRRRRRPKTRAGATITVAIHKDLRRTLDYIETDGPRPRRIRAFRAQPRRRRCHPLLALEPARSRPRC